MMNGPLAGRSILILDDDPETLELYALSLEKLGATVRRSNRVEFAIILLHTWHPDVVLCDLHLPEVDGYAFVECVRNNPYFNDVALIAISGSHPTIERERSLRAGFMQHLAKPAKLSEILAAIDAALDIARSSRTSLRETA